MTKVLKLFGIICAAGVAFTLLWTLAMVGFIMSVFH